MCIGNFTESGHGGQFMPCKNYKELEHRHTLLQAEVERLKWKLLYKTIDVLEKGPAKSYDIYFSGASSTHIIVNGWYRRDLERTNWHYYESMDGTIIHCRKDQMICVVEKEIKDASDE